jgi:hypothetical protein
MQMSGKGSGRRPGDGYEDAWERIFGKKQKEEKPSENKVPNREQDIVD